MIAAILALSVYALSVWLAFRELSRPPPVRVGRVIVSLSVMTALAVVCGGIACGGGQ